MALVVCMSANLFRELYLEMTLIMSSYKERCRAHHKIHAYTHTNLSFSVSFGTLPSSENNYPVDGDATGMKRGEKCPSEAFGGRRFLLLPRDASAQKPGGLWVQQ